MDNFNLEYHYGLFLKRINLREENMHPEQKKQLKETFYGASGQMLLILRDEISKLEEDEAIAAFEDMMNQVQNFFLSQSNKSN